MSQSPSNEVQRQFLRRTPIKLKQFSRLLGDMMDQSVDPLRVKALLSQVTKTHEACVAQSFESTARLLNQLIKQLALGGESISSQKPLLKRFSKKLLEHAEKLELGVKPQKESQQPVFTPPEPQAVEKEDEKDDDHQYLGAYIDKGKVIFVGHSNAYTELADQLSSLGVENCQSDDFASAQQTAQENQGSVIVAPLDSVELKDVLDDDSIEQELAPLIFTADEDNQENRTKAIRNHGTGFIIQPISLGTLFEQIERLYDLHAATPKRVLVMEDSKAQARYYEKVLSKGHFDIRVVNDPKILLEALRGFDPETVLMDMQMPDSSGIELTQMIRQMPRYAHLPIIFLSAEENLRKQNQALMSGGTAFIVKPVQKEQLIFMADLYTQRHRNLHPQIDVNPETKLPYSQHFKQMIAVETARMTRTPGKSALATIGLDDIEALAKASQFSFINNAIMQLSVLLRKRLRRTDMVGHLDNDRVGIMLTSGKKDDWIAILEDVQHQFHELPFHLAHKDKSLSISIGVSPLNANYNAHQWLERSQTALANAQQSGSAKIDWVDA